ncbi:putative 2-aminoethylphosphonate ABC transporter permease subunit [Peptacetobacter hominis]|uniref:Putative 2-aminoethylphosphonate ABC transporter permease subunit n=2 Tax=Peptacetobacter hominis TaxID=2743610 RepID=A0A544QWT2_9FIRM|nr:putative 2-aminoethylphosphonate ABC transporter permease subunit [Peptacetobacter hominis]
MTIIFTIVLVFPVISLFSKAMINQDGTFAGFGNYIEYFTTPALSVSIKNTMVVSIATALISSGLGFLYAYGLTKTNIKGKNFFRYAAMIPLFLPTVAHGLSLVYLFGKQGVVTMFGFDIGLYGSTGIIMSEIIYTFPQSFLMFYIALKYADGRLYEMADTLGCSNFTKLVKITLPSVKYTVINSLFVCFVLAFTDFGAPKVLGGNYNVLATDIYKQVTGLFNMNMGAVVGSLMLIPAILSFAVDRITDGKNGDFISSKSTEFKIKKSTKRDICFYVICGAVTLSFLIMIMVLFMGAFTEYYPYRMGFTVDNFRFNASTGGIQSFINSVLMSFLSAVAGTAFVLVYAYMIERSKSNRYIKMIGKLFSSIPMALPGMVIGLGFIFFFNNANNPLNFIYGTVTILVLANILHFYAVPFVTATSAMKKLDREYENVGDSMKIPQIKIFSKVVVPLSLPAILEIFLFYFMNSMVTVSAVVFLYSANFKIASIAITHMEEAGDIAQAAAMSILILVINVFARGLYEFAVYKIRVKEISMKKVSEKSTKRNIRKIDVESVNTI